MEEEADERQAERKGATVAHGDAAGLKSMRRSLPVKEGLRMLLTIVFGTGCNACTIGEASLEVFVETGSVSVFVDCSIMGLVAGAGSIAFTVLTSVAEFSL